MMDWLRELIDGKFQWFALYSVYSYEFIWFAFIALYLIFFYRRLLLSALVAVPALIYVSLYQMHLYSKVALPALYLVVGFVLMSRFCYLMISKGITKVKATPAFTTMALLFAGLAGASFYALEIARFKWAFSVVGLVFLAGLFFGFLVPGMLAKDNGVNGGQPGEDSAEFKWDPFSAAACVCLATGFALFKYLFNMSLVFLAQIVIVAILSLFFVWFLNVGERTKVSFRQWLWKNPRMEPYFDALWRFVWIYKGKKTPADYMIRSVDVVESSHEFPMAAKKKGLIATISDNAFIQWLVRLRSAKECLGNINSEFIVQNVAICREAEWRNYQASRYGKKSWQSSLETLQNAAEERDWPIQALPPDLFVFHKSDPVAYRNRWMDLTFALGQCMYFSMPDPEDCPPKEMPRLLEASAAYLRAAEVYLELSSDMRWFDIYHVRKEAEAFPVERESAARNAKACYDMAARCIETYLVFPGRSEDMVGASLDDRMERFAPSSLKAEGGEIQETLRKSLYNLYGLMLLIEEGASAFNFIFEMPRYDDRFFKELENQLGKESKLSVGKKDALLAELHFHASFAALKLAAGRQDAAFDLFRKIPYGLNDPLISVDRWKFLIRKISGKDFVYSTLAQEGVSVICHLWAMAVEQDLYFLKEGTHSWTARGQEAVDLYAYSGSSRLCRVALWLDSVSRSRRAEANRIYELAEKKVPVGGRILRGFGQVGLSGAQVENS